VSYTGEQQSAVFEGVCDACVLIDGDHMPKFVQYCKICKAWLCDMCRNSPWRRAKAAAKRHLGW